MQADNDHVFFLILNSNRRVVCVSLKVADKAPKKVTHILTLGSSIVYAWSEARERYKIEDGWILYSMRCWTAEPVLR